MTSFSFSKDEDSCSEYPQSTPSWWKMSAFGRRSAYHLQHVDADTRYKVITTINPMNQNAKYWMDQQKSSITNYLFVRMCLFKWQHDGIVFVWHHSNTRDYIALKYSAPRYIAAKNIDDFRYSYWISRRYLPSISIRFRQFSLTERIFQLHHILGNIWRISTGNVVVVKI